MEKKLNYSIVLIHIFYWLYELVAIWGYGIDLIQFLLFWPIFIGVFYLHYFILIPRMLKTPNLVSILKWYVVFFALFLGRRYLGNYLAYEVFELDGLPSSSLEFLKVWKSAILSLASNSAGILAVSLGCRYVKNRTKVKELQSQKVKSELSALKNQIDIPETISILSKLESKSKSKPASIQEEIIQLSNVLRYHLYSKEGEVILSKELDIVQNQLNLFNELNHSEIKLEHEIGDRIVKTGILSKAIGEVLKHTEKVESKLELSEIQEDTYLKISNKSAAILSDLKKRFEDKFGENLNIQKSKQTIIIQIN